jgi:hypothetical protein
LLDSKSIATGGAYSSGNGWADIASAPAGTFDTSSLGIPAGVKVLYKATTVGTKVTYQFVAYGTIGTHTPATKYDGLLQSVGAEFVYDKTTKALTVKDGKWNFWEFAAPAAATKAKWADLTAFTDIDASFGTAKTPDITLPRTDAQTDSMIELIFTSAVKKDLTQCNEGDWWYNKEDGYFYYIGKLASGQSTMNNALDAVGLKAAADNAYINLNFDLIVEMEGIQNVKDAVKSASGWGMANNAVTDALIAKLTGLNAFSA